MRDILLMILLLGGLPVALWRPFFGVCVFAWVSLMNPHRLAWGTSSDMPWALLYAVAVIAALWIREKPLLWDSFKRYFLVWIYVAWMGITTLNAADQAGAELLYVAALKIHLMAFVTLMLLNTHGRFRLFTIVIVMSVAFFGFKGGVFTFLTGGENRVWGPPNSAIADNNHLAAGLLVVFPLVYWLQQTSERRSLRIALAGGLLLIVISVLGSLSRGAFVGIIVMTLFLILKAKHRFRTLLGIGIAAAIALPIMPSSYWERIDTIESYEEDKSAQGRINTWTTAVRVANARLTGGGFDYYGSWLYQEHAPNPLAVHSAHSIYFQALGEQGWIGLILYLMILGQLWIQCSKVARRGKTGKTAEQDQLLARMLQVGLVGFMSAGAFVNIGNWDMIFYLAVVVFALSRHNESKVPVQVGEQVALGHNVNSQLSRGL